LAVASIASSSFAVFDVRNWFYDPPTGKYINKYNGEEITVTEYNARKAAPKVEEAKKPKAKKHSKLRGGAKARAKRRYARQKAAYAKLPKTKAEWQAVKADCTDEEKVLAIVKFENVLYDQLSPKEWLALKELKLIPSLPKLNRGGDLSSWNARILASHEDDVAHGRCVDLADDTVGTAIKAVMPEASEEEMLAIGDKLQGQILVIAEEGTEKGQDDIKTHARQDKLRVAKAEHKEAAEKGHGYYDPKALALRDMKKKRDKKKKVEELRAQGKTKKNKPQRAEMTAQERTEANRAKAAAKAAKRSKVKPLKKNPPRRQADDSQVEPLNDSLTSTPIKENPPIEPVRKAARAATKAQNTLKEAQEKFDAAERKATEEYKAGKRPELKGALGRKESPEEREARLEWGKAHREARRKQEDANEAAYQALKAKDPKAALKAWNDGDIQEVWAAEKKAQEKADREAEEKEEAKKQAEADAKEEAKKQEEADRKAQEEADRKAQEEADRKAQEEADRKAAEQRAQQEAYLKTAQTLTDDDMDAMEAEFNRTHPKLAGIKDMNTTRGKTGTI
jgi:hypothetical protein